MKEGRIRKLPLRQIVTHYGPWMDEESKDFHWRDDGILFVLHGVYGYATGMEAKVSRGERMAYDSITTLALCVDIR